MNHRARDFCIGRTTLGTPQAEVPIKGKAVA